MPVCFILNSKKYFCEYYPGLNVLGHAQTLELKTGSECGGHGVCGKDLFHINPEQQKLHLSLPTSIESKLLGSKKLEQGLRLGCQTYINKEPENGFLNIEILST